MDLLTSILTSIYNGIISFPRNLQTSLERLEIKDYLRLVWIVCGYLLLRPWIDSWFRKWFEYGERRKEKKEQKKMEEEDAARVDANSIRVGGGDSNATATTSGSDATATATAAKKTNGKPNGKAGKAGPKLEPAKMKVNPVRGWDWDDIEDDKEASWGVHARQKQARVMEAWEDEQAKRREEEDLADIEELLED